MLRFRLPDAGPFSAAGIDSAARFVAECGSDAFAAARAALAAANENGDPDEDVAALTCACLILKPVAF